MTTRRSGPQQKSVMYNSNHDRDKINLFSFKYFTALLLFIHQQTSTPTPLEGNSTRTYLLLKLRQTQDYSLPAFFGYASGNQDRGPGFHGSGGERKKHKNALCSSTNVGVAREYLLQLLSNRNGFHWEQNGWLGLKRGDSRNNGHSLKV